MSKAILSQNIHRCHFGHALLATRLLLVGWGYFISARILLSIPLSSAYFLFSFFPFTLISLFLLCTCPIHVKIISAWPEMDTTKANVHSLQLLITISPCRFLHFPLCRNAPCFYDWLRSERLNLTTYIVTHTGRIFDSHSTFTPGKPLECNLGLECYRDSYWITLLSSVGGLMLSLFIIARHRRLTRKSVA